MKDTRKIVRCFSTKQIEDYFESDLFCMYSDEIHDYLKGWCKEHRMRCNGEEYTYDDLVKLLDPYELGRCYGAPY